MRALRLLFITIVLFGLTHALVRTLPGDPAEAIIAESGINLSIEQVRSQMGLDRPFWQAFPRQLLSALQGDFGTSLVTRAPIRDSLAQRWPRSAALALFAVLFALAIAVTLALLSAHSPHSIWGSIAELWSAASISLPLPWLGPILMFLLAVRIPLFSLGGSVWLPAFAFGVSLSGGWLQVIRSRVSEALAQDSARAARARGISELRIVLKYGLAPVAGLLISWILSQFGHLLGGAVLTEQLFQWPGLGSLLVDSVFRRDYPVVETVVFLSAGATLWSMELGEWLRKAWDPRAR